MVGEFAADQFFHENRANPKKLIKLSMGGNVVLEKRKLFSEMTLLENRGSAPGLKRQKGD